MDRRLALASPVTAEAAVRVSRRFVPLLLLSIILPAFASPVAAAAPRVVDVEGQAASADDIAFYHCHDLDAPAIHCFLTEARLQAAIGLETARSAPGTVLRPYVEMFADISYGGASFIASLDYPDLGSIGWNNRVSSFIGLNDYVGTFYQDASYHGAYWHFLPDVHVNYVGDFWNDTFSSVTRG